MRDLIIFLDDDPHRAALMCQRMTKEDRHATMWVQTAEEAVSVLKDYEARIRQVHLDHDLGGYRNMHPGDDKSGMEVVRYLEKKDPKCFGGCEFIVHSWNVYAGKKMVERLESKGYKVKFRPFGQ